ncbi:MAG: MFS transporter, partial [Candidatus Aenigmatarchaeota archaeon]
WFYQLMLKNASVDIGYFGLVQSGLVLSQVFLMNNFCRMEKIFGSKKNLIFFSAVITGIMFIIGGLTTFLPIVLMVIFVGGGFGLSRNVLFTNYFNKHISSSKRATVLSTISMLRRLSIAVLNPFVGMLADWSFPTTLVLIGVIALASTLFSRVEEDMLID